MVCSREVIITVQPDIYPTNNESTEETSSHLVDLNKLIDSKDEENFIKNIFYGNLEDYQRTINMLNLMNSWKPSYSMLRLVFSERDIYEYSKHALRLSTIVFSRYHPASSIP